MKGLAQKAWETALGATLQRDYRTNSVLADRIQVSFTGPEVIAASYHFLVPQSASAAILSDETLSSVFAPDGKLLEEGDLIKRPKYAMTLRNIALMGADVFYKVRISRLIPSQSMHLIHVGIHSRLSLEIN